MSRARHGHASPNAVRRCLLVAAALTLLPATSATQEPSRAPTSVAVLKRIAEAVEGYPARGTVYVVVDSVGEVAAVVGSRTQADSMFANVLGRRGGIHGPYRAAPPSRLSLLARCVHSRSVMRAVCPELPIGDISRLTLMIGLRDGTSRSVELPIDADALFLTISAFDKFAFPYYARTNGVEAATEMRQRLLAEGRRP
jgi:hypothetical protein